MNPLVFCIGKPLIVLVDLGVNCNSKKFLNLNIFLDRKRRVLYTWIERVNVTYLEEVNSMSKVVVRKTNHLTYALTSFQTFCD